MIDFLIIGGGIAGTSAAARLAPLGKTVLLEGESALGYHTSGRSAALYEPNYGLASTVALNLASGAFLREHDGGFLSPRGLMLVGKLDDPEGFKSACEHLDMAAIELEAAFAMVPILNPATVGFTGYNADALDIDTDRLLQRYAKICRAAGGQVLTGQKVDSVARTAAGWAVTVGAEVYEARMVINAAGAWADQIAAMAGIAPIGLTPLRRSMARIPAPGGHDVSGWPMMMDVRETWYAKPDAGKLLVSPAEEDPQVPHDAWADDMVLAEGIARYQENVTEEVTRVESSWAGLRTFAPDRNLVIGAAVEDASFFWVAGQGGYGMQSSPAVSQLVADLIAGRASELDVDTVAALSPERFTA
jgi:glycine/D-amino acid oxidase-like deaminating enzyme